MAVGNGINDEIREQRKSMKGKGLKANLDYFFYYYKLHMAIAAAVIIIGGWFIHDAMTSKEMVFYSAAINSGISHFDDSFGDGFMDYLNLDRDKYVCNIDNSLYFDSENMNANLEVQQKIVTLSASGTLDTVIADRKSFAFYALGGLFNDLREYYNDDELAALGDRIYYVDAAKIEENRESDSEIEYKEMTYEEMKEPIPVGIILTDSSELKKIGAYEGLEPLIGICYSSGHADYSKKFIDFLTK